MIKIKDKALLLGLSELRKEIPHIIVHLKDEKIILTKKGKPVAVLQDYEEYEQREEMMENFEDLVLGMLAKEREQKSKDFISEAQMLKLISRKK